MASGDFTIKPLVLCRVYFVPPVISRVTTINFHNKKGMHQPGIEPGAPAWQAEILPLNHWYSLCYC
jgi:hypothetical protein